MLRARKLLSRIYDTPQNYIRCVFSLCCAAAFDITQILHSRRTRSLELNWKFRGHIRCWLGSRARGVNGTSACRSNDLTSNQKIAAEKKCRRKPATGTESIHGDSFATIHETWRRCSFRIVRLLRSGGNKLRWGWRSDFAMWFKLGGLELTTMTMTALGVINEKRCGFGRVSWQTNCVSSVRCRRNLHEPTARNVKNPRHGTSKTRGTEREEPEPQNVKNPWHGTSETRGMDREGPVAWNIRNPWYGTSRTRGTECYKPVTQSVRDRRYGTSETHAWSVRDPWHGMSETYGTERQEPVAWNVRNLWHGTPETHSTERQQPAWRNVKRARNGTSGTHGTKRKKTSGAKH